MQEAAKTTTTELLDESTRYLIEGSRGQAARTEDHRQKNRRMTEAANTTRTRQSKVEVKEYYDSLLRKHGTAILPHSKQILESANYREAVNTFMSIMDDRTGFSPDAVVDMENPIIADLMGDM